MLIFCLNNDVYAERVFEIRAYKRYNKTEAIKSCSYSAIVNSIKFLLGKGADSRFSKGFCLHGISLFRIQ